MFGEASKFHKTGTLHFHEFPLGTVDQGMK